PITGSSARCTHPTGRLAEVQSTRRARTRCVSAPSSQISSTWRSTTPGRRAQLFVVGARPGAFLRGTTTTVSWALGRSAPSTRERFASRFDPAMTIAEFTAGPAAHVDVIDLGQLLAELAE
ncbi:hypothetical protein, partial [Mycolicibacterium iranicum]